MKKALIILIFSSVSAFGQLSRVDIPLQTSGANVPSSAGPLPQTLWVSNATAYVCTHPSTTLAHCQANPITTYTNSTGGTPCNVATPLVQLPGSTCTASTGVTSNLGLWYAGGTFDYYISASYGTFGPYTYNVPVSGGTVTGLATIANIAALRAYNGNATSLNVIGYYSASLTSPPDGGGGIFIDQGAGASADDGGVTIYDSVSGHNWARQIPEAGLINGGWFGVNVGQTDITTQLQNSINYMCAGNKTSSLIMPSGILSASGGFSIPCNFIWKGQGIVGLFGNRYNGTMLKYTGGAITDFIKFDQGQSSTFQWSGMQIRDMEFKWAGTAPATWTNAIGFYTGSPLNQGGLYNIQFTNWTGAQLYQHVTLPSSPTSITGYISDGTGSNAGRVLCITSGSGANTAYLSGSGIAAYTFLQQTLATGSIYQLSCTGPGGGTPWLISGSNLNISSETMQIGQPDYFPYLQSTVLDQIHDQGSAQFLGHDPYGGPVWNALHISNYNHENAQTISAGVAQHYIDLSGMQLVTFSGYNIYEGATTSSPNMFGVGSFSGISLDGIYIENGSPSHPLVNVFDVMYSPIGGGLTVTNSFIAASGNQVTGHTIVFEPYVAGYLANFPNGNATWANIGNAQLNGVLGVAVPSLLSAGTFSGSSVNSGIRCGTFNEGPGCAVSTQASTTYLDAHGQWLDGLKSSMVSLSATGTNKGMVTDAIEGRVFEVQGTGGGVPSVNILLSGIPPDLYGLQFMITMRWKFSGAGGYVMCPVFPNGGLGTILSYWSGDGGIFSFCTPSLYSQSTWYTSYLVGIFPSASSTYFTAQTAIGGSAASGTTTLDIASLNVSFGNKPVYVTTGSQPTEALKLGACTAAPTYGTYAVGDTCPNSAPASGSPQGFECTVAGTPGTWKSLANLQ